MDEHPVKPRKQLEAQLIDRALKDETFRQALLRDPKGVFERELSIRIPERITVQVLEESPSTVYLVLPQSPASPRRELTDEELEEVAGGSAGCSTLEDCDFGARPTDGTCWCGV